MEYKYNWYIRWKSHISASLMKINFINIFVQAPWNQNTFIWQKKKKKKEAFKGTIHNLTANNRPNSKKFRF